MQHTFSRASIAGALAFGVAAFASAQVVPKVKGSESAQLQGVPVSGLHIGATSKLKNPYAGDPQAWSEGKKLFQAMNCAGCHAPGGGGGMGPPLSTGHWIYGGKPGDIYLSILHGRPNGMPQWGTVLPPQAIWALVTYIKTLSHPNPKFEAITKFGSKPGPGNTPHPRIKVEPPPMPKGAKPTEPTPKAPAVVTHVRPAPVSQP